MDSSEGKGRIEVFLNPPVPVDGVVQIDEMSGVLLDQPVVLHHGDRIFVDTSTDPPSVSVQTPRDN